MGIGTVEDREALRHWNEERLQDPALGRIPDDIRRKELAFARKLPRRGNAKSLSWTQQGPRNRGGRTRAFRVDITNDQVLIAGSATGGIFRSTDAGGSWSKTTAPLDIQNTSCLAQDVRTGHEQTWYCGTGENYGVVSGTSFEALLPGDGIFKSVDGGLSWSRLGSTVSGDPQVFDRKGAFKHVNDIVVDPVRMDSDIVVAAIFDGIVRSNDGGTTWSTVLGLDTTIGTTSLHTSVKVSPNGVYYASIGRSAYYKGFYRSTDGLNWTNITAGSTFPGTADRTFIAIEPGNDSTAWFLTNLWQVADRIDHVLQRYDYLSGDGSGAGGQWTNLSANLPNDTCAGFYNYDFGFFNSQGGYDMAIAIHPSDPDIVYLCGTSVYRSMDGWTTPNTYRWVGGYQCNADDPKDYVWPGHHPDQHWLEFPNGDPSRLYSATDGGVHVTTDPLADSITWVSLDDRYYTSQFYTVAIEEGAATSPFIIGGMQDNGTYLCTSADPDEPWVSVHGSDGAYCAISEGREFMLMCGQQGKLYKKAIQDDGTIDAYERFDPELANPSYNFINQMLLDPHSGNTLYWCHASRLYRHADVASVPLTNNYYQDAETGWEQLDVPGFSGRTCALDIGLAAAELMLVGTTTGRVYRIDSLNGVEPVRTTLNSDSFPNFPRYVSCVAPNDFNAGEWLLTFCNYGIRSVFHTVDTGTTWTSVSGNIEEFPNGAGNGPAVYWGMIYPMFGGVGNRYFIGTSTGLYSTDHLDGDNTVWEQEGADLIGNVPINMMVSRGSDGLVAVGTHGSGVFTAHMPAAPIGIGEGEELNTSNAWPNPANDAVNLNYHLSGPADVTARVFDIHGRTLLSRSLGTRPAGNGMFSWDLRSAGGGRVPAGTYLLQLSSSGLSRVERVVVR